MVCANATGTWPVAHGGRLARAGARPPPGRGRREAATAAARCPLPAARWLGGSVARWLGGPVARWPVPGGRCPVPGARCHGTRPVAPRAASWCLVRVAEGRWPSRPVRVAVAPPHDPGELHGRWPDPTRAWPVAGGRWLACALWWVDGCSPHRWAVACETWPAFEVVAGACGCGRQLQMVGTSWG